jgi:hypothetical protein
MHRERRVKVRPFHLAVSLTACVTFSLDLAEAIFEDKAPAYRVVNVLFLLFFAWLTILELSRQ